MRFGVALVSATQAAEAPVVLGHLDRWAQDAGAYPAVFPLWSRLGTDRAAPDGRGFPDPLVLAGLALRDVEPMVYMTTTGVTYGEILAGRWDEHYEAWGRQAAAYGKPVIVRLDQEPNGRWAAPWAGSDPREYAGIFSRVELGIRHMGGARNVRMFYCPVWRGREHAADLERYYPGDACQVVGFDAYARADEPAPLARRWSAAIDALRSVTPDKPIVVGEYGIRRGIAGRHRLLRDLRDLDDIEAAVYMDMDLDHIGPGHRWAMGRRMREELGRMIRL